VAVEAQNLDISRRQLIVAFFILHPSAFIFLIRGRSSMEKERFSANEQVEGSSPSDPISLKVKINRNLTFLTFFRGRLNEKDN
jgi:hypothetical protein